MLILLLTPWLLDKIMALTLIPTDPDWVMIMWGPQSKKHTVWAPEELQTGIERKQEEHRARNS